MARFLPPNNTKRPQHELICRLCRFLVCFEENLKTPEPKMIYLATYSRKSETEQCQRKTKHLIFIEASDRLGLDRVVALVGTLTAGNFEASSVEIIGQKAWDAARIKHPGIQFYKLD
jgi:hypothetical protein